MNREVPAFLSRRGITGSRLNRRLYISRWYYLMMVPGLLYYLLFHYLPMGGLLIAFQDYNLMEGIWGSAWVGFNNFIVLFESPDFWVILRNTLVISLYRILFTMTPDIILALLLNEVRIRWFKQMVQSITYGPFFLSWVIIYGLVFAFLAPEAGLISSWYRDMGWGTLNLMTDKDWFRPILIITDVWKSTGYGSIIYLAAIASINPELYEAAVADGAGRWRQLWHITLPGIRNVIILLLILRIGHIMDAGFEQVYIFLNARVYETGDIIDTWVYRRGIEQLDFSVAAAVGFFKSAIGLTLVLGANYIAKRTNGSGIW
ncbi:sugar ABC transporter permease [Paenibacillus sp. PAMC21692]|uniref:ABC transporter permease n=1 Tax=Paenibacillus sp. PAMC21692 TaxID=2762320 RepID=UPI00164D0E19|nr:ABC transporter permease subunit [Paenibacillus sp. PAMC21692]QNK57227.1 sugar ABC transporter permease [Paenibacillus sp. PAMC21692]